MMVSSVPAGAKVFLNESYKGDTPMFKRLKAGKYAVKVVKEGYQSYHVFFNLTAGGDKKLAVKLVSK